MKPWRTATMYASAICIFVLGMFLYWFGIADRYTVFLYHHDMGALYPDTSPFSAVTSSRYWMTGLVVSGAVMVLYVTVNWVLGRLADGYCAPDWWRVWVLCAVVLLVGIPMITMTANQPTLRIANAACTTLVTIGGLAMALLPGLMAAERPSVLAWLGLDGLALALVLLSLVGLDRLGTWLDTGRAWIVWMMVAVLFIDAAGLLLITGLRVWRRAVAPSAVAVLLAGFGVAYLLLPLVHHLIGTNGYFYISDRHNFFSGNILVQFLIWLIAWTLALGVSRLQRVLVMRATAAPDGSA